MPAVVAPIFACPEHPVLDTVSVSGSRELFQDISAVLDIPPSRKRTVDSPVTVGGRRRKLPRRRSKSGGGMQDWRLSDTEFDTLHKEFSFTLEGCCDRAGLNGHARLPYYSGEDSLLNHEVTGQRSFLHPPLENGSRCGTACTALPC